MAVNGRIVTIIDASTRKAVAAGIKTCKINTECDTIEVASATSAQFREFIAGRIKWSMSCSWLVMAVGDIKKNALQTGKTYVLRFGTTSNYVTGTAILNNCEIDASIGSLAKGSFLFQGSGAIT